MNEIPYTLKRIPGWAKGAALFVLGGVAASSITYFTEAGLSSFTEEEDYAVLTKVCSPIKQARITLENVRTGKRVSTTDVRLLNQVVVQIRNAGRLYLQNPKILIELVGFETSPKLLFADIFANSVLEARDTAVEANEGGFVVSKGFLNPDESISLVFATDRPTYVHVEIRQPGLNYVELREPGCKDDLSEEALGARTSTYTSDVCARNVNDSVECKIDVVSVPFNIPDDFAPGDKVNEYGNLSKNVS